MDYINIESTTGDAQGKVRQDLKFRTGKFVWRVKFTAPLDPKTVNNTNLYVTDANSALLSTTIRYDAEGNFIEIEPLEPYAKDSEYTLTITKNVKSKGGQTLKSDSSVQFKV